ncbi:MAG: co-chaperone GroES [Pseudomonadales bacterium]
MHIKPLNDRVIARRIEDNNITSGGIVLPDKAKEKSMEGEVVAVGSGRQLNNGEIKRVCVAIGDKVLFEKFAGTDIKFEGEKLVALREDDIICVVVE